MNICFTYNWLSELDTNRSNAAFRWATLGRQTGKLDSTGNPISNPEIVYVYHDGTQVIDGGKYDLISRINKELRNKAGIRETMYMVYDPPINPDNKAVGIQNNTATKSITGNSASAVGSNISTEATTSLTTTGAIGNEVLDIIPTSDTAVSTPKTAVNNNNNNAVSRRESKVKVVFSKEDTSNFIESYIDKGYRLNEEELPLTMELYHRALMHVQTREFKEDFDKSNPDSGSNYKIGSYICTLLFADGKYVGQRSWIEGQIGTLTGKYEILQDREYAIKTGLTVTDEEGKESPSNEVEVALGARKINPEELIESEDSFKEIFCVLALVNVMYKNDLWELIAVNYVKMSSTVTNGAFGKDRILHEVIMSCKAKLNRKDVNNARDNGSLNQEVYHSKSWVYKAISQAINYLGLPHINLDVQHINCRFLERTDLIRECNTAEEFLSAVKYDSGKISPRFSNITRERVIGQKLDLSNNYHYLSYGDVVKLALAPISRLPQLIEKALVKIENAKSEKLKSEDKIRKYEMAIIKLKEQLSTGIHTGESIDLTTREYSVGELDYRSYACQFKPSNVANTHTEYLCMNIRNGVLSFVDHFGRPTNKYAGYKLGNFLNFAVAKIEPIGELMTKEVKEKYHNQIKMYQDAILAEKKEIAKLNGTHLVFEARNVARPSDMVECEALILNTWVDPLVDKFRTRNFNIKDRWESYKSLPPNASQEEVQKALKAKKDFEVYSALAKVNLDSNLKCCLIECKSTFSNNFQGYVDASVNCKNWLLVNRAINIHRDQDVKLFEVTSDGSKQNHGGTPTRAFLRKEGVYVLTTDIISMIIPAWYGCLEQNSYIRSTYIRGVKGYSDTLTSVIASFTNFYQQNKNNPEAIEALSEETGVYFLTKEDAYEHIMFLKENYPNQLVYSDYDKTGKSELRYHITFELLAKAAGVILDNPNQTLKAERIGSITLGH